MTRADIIEYLDDNYNTQEDCEYLEEILLSISNVADLDDNDPEEGMYHTFSTSQLAKAMSILDNKYRNDINTITLHLTYAEYDLLKNILIMFSDPAFSKNPEESRQVRRMLKQMD